MSRWRRHVPFLTGDEVLKVAGRLHTTPHVVETVLRIAGHVIRERYREHEWLPSKRDDRANNPVGGARERVANAILQELGPEEIESVG